jgi:hypothetical protein
MTSILKFLGAFAGIATIAASLAFAADSPPANDKYGAKVPGGLAFSEFKGFESWEAISVSSNEKAVAVILGNPAMIAASKPASRRTGSRLPTAPGWRKSTGPRQKTRSFPMPRFRARSKTWTSW